MYTSVCVLCLSLSECSRVFACRASAWWNRSSWTTWWSRWTAQKTNVSQRDGDHRNHLGSSNTLENVQAEQQHKFSWLELMESSLLMNADDLQRCNWLYTMEKKHPLKPCTFLYWQRKYFLLGSINSLTRSNIKLQTLWKRLFALCVSGQELHLSAVRIHQRNLRTPSETSQ